MYSKNKIRVGFALSEKDMNKLKQYMQVNSITNISKAFLHLLNCASVECVPIPKTEYGYILECLRSAKLALKDSLDGLEIVK